MKSRILSYLVGATFLVALPLAAIAQPSQGSMASTTGTVTGTVVSRTPDTIVIGTENHGVMKFAITSHSSIPMDVQDNNYVQVNYREVPGGGPSEVISVSQVPMPTNQAEPAPATASKVPSRSMGSTPEAASNNAGAGSSAGMAAATSQQSSQASSSQPAAASQSKELPHTASSLPLIGLLGLLATGGAVASRFFLRA